MYARSRSSTACRVGWYRPRLSRMNEPDSPGRIRALTAIAAAGATIQGLGSRLAVGREVTAKPASAPRANLRASGRRQAPPESLTGTMTDPSTRPKNSARIVSGEDSTSLETGPATVKTVAVMPIMSGKSEERRVGKEGRTRWTRGEQTKNERTTE